MPQRVLRRLSPRARRVLRTLARHPDHSLPVEWFNAGMGPILVALVRFRLVRVSKVSVRLTARGLMVARMRYQRTKDKPE